jgi:CYTH domain-containing protein
MKKGIMHLFFSLEELATGKAYNEVEYVFYAKLSDPALLSRAISKEHHEQWELKIPKTPTNAAGGRVRIRKTLREGNPAEYVLTTKTKLPVYGEKEVATPSSEDAFIQFKTMSDRGMVKTRYCFDAPGKASKWEVDVFLKEDGSLCEWVKIDFEVTEADQECPPLMAGFSEAISPFNKTSEQEAFIRTLYDTVFLKTNEALPA